MLRRRLQKANKWPQKGSSSSLSSTRMDSPLIALRISVLPTDRYTFVLLEATNTTTAPGSQPTWQGSKVGSCPQSQPCNNPPQPEPSPESTLPISLEPVQGSSSMHFASAVCSNSRIPTTSARCDGSTPFGSVHCSAIAPHGSSIDAACLLAWMPLSPLAPFVPNQLPEPRSLS